MIGPAPKIKLGKAERIELTHYEKDQVVWCITSKLIIDTSKPNGQAREYFIWKLKDNTLVRQYSKSNDPTLLYP